MALTDTFIKTTKHSGKPAGDKHSDGGGLYLHVTRAGKYWRMAYRYAGKQKTLAFGVYPTVTLKQAREKRETAKELLAQGLDPGVVHKTQKIGARVAAVNTFEAVALEFHETQAELWSDSYAAKWLRSMQKDAFPYVGKIPLADVTAPIVLDCLRRVEKRGSIDTAHTLRQSFGQVFRYGIQTGRCTHNPAPDLVGATKPRLVKHHAAILEPQKVGELLRAFEEYTGHPTTKAALQLSALFFQRPGNIRQMQWDWVDFDRAMMTIPSEEMKRRKLQKINGRPHFVPLAKQAIAILQEIHPLTGRGRYVFPSLRTGERPMSENTVNAALRRLGFSSDEMTAHGFRAMARTVMVEHFPDVSPDVLEAQLAHGKSGPLGAAYDRADFMAQRVKMMQQWADYLDRLRDGAEVIHLHRKSA